ncbi:MULTISPECIES: glycosyltransferase family 2 protein [unclassified Thioalkalivibrio]|uniref:glycosyltransferase family 2 protein n=1 Tax=unclassified Thioalkalivibrio TaxID=2621013 RepID=UPI000379FB4A|nr:MULTISPECIES: glycosyltransferase family 2 protein [unclassified Thioalkalivibrio]
MSTVVALIPAHNEAATIEAVVAGARAQVDRVIVVDDGSDDATARLIEDQAEVLRMDENSGKASALWAGMQHALATGAEAVVTLDADGQHDTTEIPALVAAWHETPNRLVLGARLKGREHTPPLRLFGNRMADFWIAWASGQPLRDSQSGFRLYPAALLRRLDLAHHRARGFVFESEALIVAERLGFPARVVPVRCIYPENHRPSHYRPTADTLRIIAMVAGHLLRRGMRPLGLLRSLGVIRR